MIHRGGDCEDTSILTSALLDSMGYDVVLVNLPNHVAVGIALDTYGTYWLFEETRYFYVETTGEGWTIGVVPDAHKGQPAQLYPILPVPVCIVDWAGSSLRHKLTLVINVENVGTGEARGIKIQAAYDGGDEVLWNAVESEFFDLNVDDESTIILELDEPRNVHTRILVRIIDPWGYIMDESYSEWFNTD